MKQRKPRKLPKSVRPEEWDKLVKEVKKKKDMMGHLRTSN